MLSMLTEFWVSRFHGFGEMIESEREAPCPLLAQISINEILFNILIFNINATRVKISQV